MQERLTIGDRKAAAIFASVRQRHILQVLIPQELTLSALARVTRTPLSLLHYHVARCIELGLIEIVREQPRAGRPIRFYRATAATFFVPVALLTELPGTGLNRKLRELLDENLARSLQGIDFTHDGRNPRAHLVKEPLAAGLAVELWLDAGISRTDAQELMAEMQALVDRYRARSNSSEPRHLIHLAAVRF